MVKKENLGINWLGTLCFQKADSVLAHEKEKSDPISVTLKKIQIRMEMVIKQRKLTQESQSLPKGLPGLLSLLWYLTGAP